jgi:protein tyrosine phosphatase (PTP) superfamily phosphohydrolase (DUF442 family)
LKYDVIEVPTVILFDGDKPIKKLVATRPNVEAMARLATSVLKASVPNQFDNAKLVPFTEQISFGAQPSTLQLQNLDKIGVKSVVNLRHRDEKDFDFNEETILTEKGVHYRLIEIMDGNDVDAAVLQTVVDAIDGAAKPVLVHCTVGLVAGSLAMASEAKRTGAAASDVMEWSRDLGVKLADKPQLYQTITEFLA